MKRRDFIGAGVRLLAGAASSTPRVSRGSRLAPAVTLKTLEGGTVAVDPAALADLQRGLEGDLLIAGMADYDAARRIWNAAVDRHPAVVVRCAGVRDIVHAVRFAGRHHAVVSVRGGGHNAAGLAVCDGGVMVDLARLRTVDVDPARKTARAAGGATFADYDAATGRFGFASTGPIISMVGVGGYTLGGGMGWLHRKLGLACDNLISAQVVTADGTILETSRTRHEDLFWALRGGGGNFGIVSAFEFRLAPVSSVIAGLVIHPLEDLPAIAAFVRDFNATAPDDVSVWLMMRKAPASPALPAELHGRLVAVIAVCYAGPGGGERVLRPLRRFGRPLLDRVAIRSYADWQRSLDAAWGPGYGNQWLGHYLADLSDAGARTMLEHVARVTSPFTDVKLVQLGGAVARVGEDETAFSNRASGYALAVQTRWAPDDRADVHLAWSQDFFEAMRVHSTGRTYVNFMADEGEARVTDAYNGQTLQRLRAVKAAYDPDNRFRMNQNIRPASAPTRR